MPSPDDHPRPGRHQRRGNLKPARVCDWGIALSIAADKERAVRLTGQVKRQTPSRQKRSTGTTVGGGASAGMPSTIGPNSVPYLISVKFSEFVMNECAPDICHNGSYQRMKLKTLFATAFCAGGAAWLSFVLRGSDDRLLAPTLFAVVVAAAGLLWGRASALLGGVASVLVFDLLLFPPIGSIRVSDPIERMSLVLLGWAAILLWVVIPPEPKRPKDRLEDDVA